MPTKKDREKYKEYYTNYRRQNREKLLQYGRLNQIKNKYNLSAEDYLKLIEQQNNKCAICNNEESCKSSAGYIRPLSVDHDHKTGKVRGLLCQACNTMLGYAKDDIERLFKAIEYLNKWQ